MKPDTDAIRKTVTIITEGKYPFRGIGKDNLDLLFTTIDAQAEEIKKLWEALGGAIFHIRELCYTYGQYQHDIDVLTSLETALKPEEAPCQK